MGASVIHGYAPAVTGETFSRGEKVLRIGAYIVRGAIAAFLVLLLVVTILAFLVASISN